MQWQNNIQFKRFQGSIRETGTNQGFSGTL